MHKNVWNERGETKNEFIRILCPSEGVMWGLK